MAQAKLYKCGRTQKKTNDINREIDAGVAIHSAQEPWIQSPMQPVRGQPAPKSGEFEFRKALIGGCV
jgi:hypothetical protein